jgi:hypothetical protein
VKIGLLSNGIMPRIMCTHFSKIIYLFLWI